MSHWSFVKYIPLMTTAYHTFNDALSGSGGCLIWMQHLVNKADKAMSWHGNFQLFWNFRQLLPVSSFLQTRIDQRSPGTTVCVRLTACPTESLKYYIAVQLRV